MDDLDETGFTRQINVRVDPRTVRSLRTIRAHTGEEYSPLIRRVINQEAERIVAEEATRR